MENKKGINPLMLIIGVVAGAAGALVLSEKKPKLAKSVLGKIKSTLSDWEALGKQNLLDQSKSKSTKSKK